MCADLFCEPVRECPLFTVIVPVYNAAAYLGQCLESIRTQSFADWEAICVDDGSQDASPDILRQYAARDDRFRVLTQENRGVSSARNSGLDAARGRYILFVDADDYLEVNALEILCCCMNERELNLLFFRTSNSTRSLLEDVESAQSLTVSVMQPNEDCLVRVAHPVWGKVFRREIIEQYHLRFFVGVQVGEDLFFVLAYLLVCRSCGSYDLRGLYQYRTEAGVTRSLYERWAATSDEELGRMLGEPLLLLELIDRICPPERLRHMRRGLLRKMMVHFSWCLERIAPERRGRLVLYSAWRFLRAGRIAFAWVYFRRMYPGLEWVRRLISQTKRLMGRGDSASWMHSRAQRVAILNLAGCSNYGDNLAAYALCEQCRKWGYQADLINRRHVFSAQWKTLDDAFARFGRAHLSWTRRICGPADMALLARDYETFIIGSEQAWASQPTWQLGLVSQRGMFDVDNLPSNVRRIAMAAGFGSSDYSHVPEDFVRARRAALQRFQAISVREAEGVAICRDVYGVSAEYVLDPVFLLGAERWELLAFESRRELPESFAVICVLHEPYIPMAQRVASALHEDGMSVVELLQGEEVADWLMSIRCARVVVTDSFHVACFALIFRRPLVLFPTESGDGDRLLSLLKRLHGDFPIFDEAALLEHPEETLPAILDSCSRSVSYEPIVSALEEQINKTRAFLARALQTSIPNEEAVGACDEATARAERRQFRCALWRQVFRNVPQWGCHLLWGIASAASRRKRDAEWQSMLRTWRMWRS